MNVKISLRATGEKKGALAAVKRVGSDRNMGGKNELSVRKEGDSVIEVCQQPARSKK